MALLFFKLPHIVSGAALYRLVDSVLTSINTQER